MENTIGKIVREKMRKSTIILSAIAVVELIIILAMVKFVFREDPELIKLRQEYAKEQEETYFLNKRSVEMADELDKIADDKDKAVSDSTKKIVGIDEKLKESESKRASLKKKLEGATELQQAYNIVVKQLELAENEIGDYKQLVALIGKPIINGFMGSVPQIEFPEGSITYALYHRGNIYREQSDLYKDNWLREIKLRELSEQLTEKTGQSRKFTLIDFNTSNVITFGLGILGGLGLSKIL